MSNKNFWKAVKPSVSDNNNRSLGLFAWRDLGLTYYEDEGANVLWKMSVASEGRA